ncbi:MULTISPECIES: DUF3800 domain-containing protein [unclassified Ensifer]|uniref:DUF3800 domain-containing protein n=1 Tax=unclassified Ensifer TaxID=2633371 RepID=UPI000813A553|nr:MULTISPECIES: DUF3800 domain-containing protein [unclassified Ensifer]OCP02211.1 hypothetical protein BC374_28240 [Ensifer sp. LC13]OCP02270.1 hypothetical protein BBX50_28230 [Ensifer sp. LC11]OCP08222.1 hypothetical protein BC362_09650 [Ensifer sp. LC14]OCP29787.1 hypothetical protein BC364_28140 [Ensifer sp. LC499]
MYRLYVDEVGTDDITHLADDNNRYLSLSGVAMKIVDARDDLTPKFNWIKAAVLEQDPDDPVIFHRTDIVQKKRAFGVLNDPQKRDLFDRGIHRAMSTTPYTVITALIDKLGMVNQPRWQNQHPYHYLMEILLEKYTQFLERVDDIGDVMPEGRKGKKDTALQAEFAQVLQRGTYFVSAARMQKRIASPTLERFMF